MNDFNQTQQQIWEKLWSRPVSYEWDIVSQTVYEQIIRHVGAVEGLQIAEAGSGTGKISLRLAQEGAHVTLIDYSEQALSNSREVFDEAGLTASYIHADIAQLPMPEKFYDIVWNAGVLEHFSYEEQVNILKELARITKENGLLIILTPSAAALAYRVGKYTSEQAGTWMYGTETPVETLTTAFRDAGVELLEEYNTGFLGSLEFLDFINGAAPVKEAMKAWFLSLTEEEQSLFPGYLLCSVGVIGSKPDQVQAPHQETAT